MSYEDDPIFLEGFNAPREATNPYEADESNYLRIAMLASKDEITDEELRELKEMVDENDSQPYSRWELGYFSKHDDIPLDKED